VCVIGDKGLIAIVGRAHPQLILVSTVAEQLVLWLMTSLLFKLYVANFADYEGSYGTVGAVIVVLLWFYVSGIAILTGAELNSEIEHASPYGKAPGQKTAQGKLLIGARASRAFEKSSLADVVMPGPPIPPSAPAPPRSKLGVAIAAAILSAKWWNRRRE
jgi:membrane protein